MDYLVPIAITFFCALVFYVGRRQGRRRKQLQFIANYHFHGALATKVAEKYPHLKEDERLLVMDGLRDYFRFCNLASTRMVSMPSQVVDVAWHEFILFTRHYEGFCRTSFGRFLHHTPSEAMTSQTNAQDGIKRAWRLACKKESIDPQRPDRLPLLFAMDALLRIEDGFHYSLDCMDPRSPNYGSGYCASHIGCGGGCAGGGCGGGSGCGGDSGSGCGGGGCGGD